MEWIARLKDKDLRVNMGMTKVMNCKMGIGQVENSGKFPCGVCGKGVDVSSVCCTFVRNGHTGDVVVWWEV